MGIVFQHVYLERDEHIRWSKSVGIARSGGRPLGGQLIFTDRRVAFRPAQWERLFQATQWSAPLAKVDFLDIVPSETLPANMRSLFRIHLKDGTDQFFNFNGKKKALRVLGETTNLRIKLDSPLELLVSSAPVRSRSEIVIPIITAGFLAAAIATADWIAWVLVAVGTLSSAGYLRNRVLRRRARRRQV
jgi:hypothetical protein